jgi:hypothetical protein
MTSPGGPVVDQRLAEVQVGQVQHAHHVAVARHWRSSAIPRTPLAPCRGRRRSRRVLALPDNPYRQRPDTADTVAALLLNDLADPLSVLEDIPVTGDPRTQLADVVALHDPDGLGGAIQGSVIGIRRSLAGNNGLADVLAIRATHTR